MPRLDEIDTEDSDGQDGGAQGNGTSLADRTSQTKTKRKTTSTTDATNGALAQIDRDVKEEDEGSDEEDADDDEAEDEFEVEAIHGHEYRRKGKGPYTLLYNIKWKGYPKSDNTLEPEDNLQDSRDLLAAYHLKIGGAPQPPDSSISKKRPQKNLSTDSPAETPPANSKRRRTADPDSRDSDQVGSWVPKLSSWEDEIKVIETVERDVTTGDLFVYITFKNGKKSKVKRDMVHRHCPLAMLKFYEAHLNFEGPS